MHIQTNCGYIHYIFGGTQKKEEFIKINNLGKLNFRIENSFISVKLNKYYLSYVEYVLYEKKNR